jgi:hypothetical protein
MFKDLSYIYKLFVEALMKGIPDYYLILKELLLENLHSLEKLLLSCVIKGDTFTIIKEIARARLNPQTTRLRE